MILKALFLSISFIIPIYFTQAQKKIIDHSVYATWKKIKSSTFSNDGKKFSVEIGMQERDGFLVWQDFERNLLDTISRGVKPKISSNSNYLVFQISHPYDTVRKLKLKKIKTKNLPKDSLAIFVFGNDTVVKFQNVESYKLPSKKSDWIIILYDKNELEKQKIKEKGKTKNIKEKKNSKGKTLVIFNPILDIKYSYKNISTYQTSKDGSLISFTKKFGIKSDSVAMYAYDIQKYTIDTILLDIGIIGKTSLNENGSQIAFLFSDDTTKHKQYALYQYTHTTKEKKMLVDTSNYVFPSGWGPSNYGSVYYSEDASKLYFHIAPYPKPEIKDTLLADEKVNLDIWSWHDNRLQTHQLKTLKKDKKKSYLSVYHLTDKNIVQIEDTITDKAFLNFKQNDSIAFLTATKPYQKYLSWENYSYRDIYTINLKTGKKKLILKKFNGYIAFSSTFKYLVYFDYKTNTYYSYSTFTEKHHPISKGIANLLNNEHDKPSLPLPYGIGGWTKGDTSLFIYDKYDIWKVNPEGLHKAKNITNRYGEKNKIVFRCHKLNSEVNYLNSLDYLFIIGFNKLNKSMGYYKVSPYEKSNPELLYSGNYYLSVPKKCKDTDSVFFTKSSFTEYPDFWLADMSFKKQKKLTYLGKQNNDYNLGTVELVKWKSFDKKKLEGLLYKPENFDAKKKYPLIVYFYEKYSDNFHRYYYPNPSRSVINFPLYVSNGYIVFIPNITYKNGMPGRSAYEDIISGTENIMKFKWIDKDNIGIQGQSWGGYQVAYLITQTNMFKAANAGAPVSNMTSAYGGIRWGSGLSRMSQYEEGQSRIGYSLWENRKLYIDNSPIFFADKIETPLLIMHNQRDGAVPWAQGVELFVALRRLQKPVWLLNYNNDYHNLVRWANRVDFSIRQMQFFDHFLKGKPAPDWLKNGVPATKKEENETFRFKYLKSK